MRTVPFKTVAFDDGNGPSTQGISYFDTYMSVLRQCDPSKQDTPDDIIANAEVMRVLIRDKKNGLGNAVLTEGQWATLVARVNACTTFVFSDPAIADFILDVRMAPVIELPDETA